MSKFKKWKSVKSGAGGQSTSYMGHGRTGLLVILSSLIVLSTSFPIWPPAASDLPVAETASGQLTFTAAGDLGITAFSDASLRAIPTTGGEFHLALGDLSYNGTGTEASFCDYVTSRVGDTFPFELVSGNHEDGAAGAPGPDGYIGDFAACLPDRISGLPYSSGYAKEYYFDYPTTNPLVRVVMISPALHIDGVSYNYSVGRPNYNWLSNTIDEARNTRIPWVIVGMHKPCITMGIKLCETGPDLMNLLITKRVDLVLQGHDHNYQRSKQLTCAGAPTRTVEATYDPSCVVDDGSDGVYRAGSGTVFVISGAFGGGGFTSVNTSDPEAGYFAKAMGGQGTVWGSTATGTGRGLVRYTVSADRIDAELVITTQTTPGTLFSDSFGIAKNKPPVLSPIGDQAIDEETPLSFNAIATDPDGDTMSFSVGPSPTGAFAEGAEISSVTGAFSWTPAEAQGPGTYTARITVSDGALTVFEDITIIVIDVNRAPELTAPGPRTIAVGNTLMFTVTATDPDIPQNAIILSATDLPTGATFNPVTGDFEFAPDQSHQGQVFTVNFMGKDDGTPPLSDTKTVSITVPSPLNQPPVLDAIGDKTVDEEKLLRFTATASDPNDGDVLTFSLTNAPSGAIVDSTGHFSWRPTEAQGPGTFTVMIIVSDGPLTDSETIAIAVNEVNSPPNLSVPGPQRATVGTALTFIVTAGDPDIPANTLFFSLDTGTPEGATITPSGVFSWTPTQAQALANHLVTIIVTDNGSPTTTDSETLIITVAETKQAPSRPSEPWQQYWYLIVAGAVSAVAIPILVKKILRTKTRLTE